MLRLLPFAMLFVGLAACTPAEQSPGPAEAAESTEESASMQPVGPTPAPENVELRIISPEDGATIEGPVTVVFGLSGMGVAPAGVQSVNTGHHHLLVDMVELPDLTRPIPADGNHVHFGGGQTQTVLDLEPGTHTLQLILGDWSHTPHDPPVVSERITITVQ